MNLSRTSNASSSSTRNKLIWRLLSLSMQLYNSFNLSLHPAIADTIFEHASSINKRTYKKQEELPSVWDRDQIPRKLLLVASAGPDLRFRIPIIAECFRFSLSHNIIYIASPFPWKLNQYYFLLISILWRCDLID